MKESKNSVDIRCIFRETFDSEDYTRSLGGLPTAVTYQNGVGVFNGTSSYIQYNKPLNGVYSVRIRFTSFTPVNGEKLTDFRQNSGIGFIQILSDFRIGTTLGTIYVNGLASNQTNTSTKEIIVSGINLLSSIIVLGSIYSLGLNFLNASIERLEIYKGTLTASEVKNLFENKAYKPMLPHGEILEPELIINPNFSGNWSSNGEATFVLNNARLLSTAGVLSSLNCAVVLVVGKYYKAVLNIIGTTSGNWQIGAISSEYAFTTPQTGVVTVFFTAIESNLNLKRSGGACDASFSSVSVKEVLSTANLILDVNCNKGTIRNSLAGSVLNGVTVPQLVNTNVVPVRDGNIWSQRFLSNGILNCGSYHNLLGDLTINIFFKPRSFGTSEVGKIIDNSKLKIGLNTTNAVVNCTSDGSTVVTSASSVVKLGRWSHLAILRKSDGKVSFYIDEVLSGSADQNSGTPVAGSTIYVGTTASSNYFDGELPIVQVFSGILSIQEISQIRTSMKSKFNL